MTKNQQMILALNSVLTNMSRGSSLEDSAEVLIRQGDEFPDSYVAVHLPISFAEKESHMDRGLMWANLYGYETFRWFILAAIKRLDY